MYEKKSPVPTAHHDRVDRSGNLFRRGVKRVGSCSSDFEIRYSIGLQKPSLVAWSAQAVSPTIKSSQARNTIKSPGLLSGGRR